ncbi:DNA mismatch repair protein MutS [Clostridium sp.]|uniref:DNA mismatch repair protein MutS n=1 Tax=Clostridium sp. TaxID=1506 RepID=UPI002FC8391A
MALTPMMKQYFEVKEKCKDCIVFFRLGDFYEMFFEDAEVASRELELTLTGRDCGLEKRAPMCGVPFHAAENYISRLVSKGYKVAICEQVEDPAFAKGIVKRDVIKIVTPGTYTEGSFLEESKNNFIMSLYIDENNSAGVCFCDISTGEFYCSEGYGEDAIIIDEIYKFEPKEIVVPENLTISIVEDIKERASTSISIFDKSNFNDDSDMLRAQFKNFNNTSLGNAAIRACNGLLNYILDTQKASLTHIDFIECYEISQYLSLDANSKRNLEITETLRDKSKKGTLLWVMDKTNTAMGARRLRKWVEQPLMLKREIESRQEAIEELITNTSLLEDLKEGLKQIYDIERLVGKISSKSINAKELIGLKHSIWKIPLIKNLISCSKSNLLSHIFKNLDDLQDVFKILDDSLIESPSLSIKEGNIIKDGYNNTVDELRASKTNGKQWLASLESDERKTTGIKSLKISYNKVFGYFIEITKANLSSIPEGRYIRKQTLSNAERFITPELKEMEDKILGAEDKLIAIEYEIFVEIRDFIETQSHRMKDTAKLISELDALSSLAMIAKENNYCRPEINTDGFINVEGGRHPVVEKMIPINTFVDNDTNIDTLDNQLMLITGPNMAGKSTYMRQVALITIMAQIGSFVPAKGANISICDKIFTRIGASDDLAGGKSTFMVEMWEVSNILKNATTKSLVLLDEVGRGTSTYDGLSIAWSVIEYICNTFKIKCKTLFATHYHELTRLEGEISGVKNYSIAVRKIQNEIIFLRKIISGAADESYGIEVAKLAGIPQEVINRAREILQDLEGENFKEINRDEYEPKKKEKLEKDNGNSFEAYEEKYDSNLDRVHQEVAMAALEKNKTEVIQMGFEDIAKGKLIEDLKAIDVLNLTPMEGFNKLYEFIKKAKEI